MISKFKKRSRIDEMNEKLYVKNYGLLLQPKVQEIHWRLKFNPRFNKVMPTLLQTLGWNMNFRMRLQPWVHTIAGTLNDYLQWANSSYGVSLHFIYSKCRIFMTLWAQVFCLVTKGSHLIYMYAWPWEKTSIYNL